VRDAPPECSTTLIAPGGVNTGGIANSITLPPHLLRYVPDQVFVSRGLVFTQRCLPVSQIRCWHIPGRSLRWLRECAAARSLQSASA